MIVDIVTPSRRLRSVQNEDVRLPADCSHIIVPGREGEFEVGPGHAPFLTLLGTGLLTLETGGRTVKLMVSGGFCEVDRERVTVMCETAALPEEVQVDAVQSGLQAVEKKLSELGAASTEDESFQRLRTEAERAASQLRLVR
ncbi:MAG: ATP synthase F1 subunit epsilon [Myxococcota bacterium]